MRSFGRWRSAPARILFLVLLVLSSASLLFAQAQSGTVVGKITDKDGAALPGVTVTLSGIGAPVTFVTTAEGDFRFLGLHPGTYSVTAELSGFATAKHQVEVALNKSSELDFRLAQSLAAEITVTGAAPVIDRRSTGTGAVVDSNELQNVPTARDPWVVLQSVPGVLVDRVNVGGNESGQQSYFVGKGVERSQTEWNIDGVPVSDMAATGTSAFYYDFDSFDEMQVSTGTSDPSVRTPGVHLNMVTKRGTNDFRGSSRYFTTGKGLQSKASVPSEAKGYLADGVNSVDHIDDYGVEAGGPIIRDRLWFWGAYSNNGINNFAAANAVALGTSPVLQKTKINNANAKMNLQALTNNDASIFFMWNDKKVAGRGLSPTRPIETAQNQSGPGYILKFADTQIFGQSLYLTATLATIKNGYTLTPIGGRNQDAWWDSTSGWHRTYKYFTQDAPQKDARLDGSYFAKTGAVTHELKFGFGYRDTPVQSSTVWPGSGNFGNIYDGYALAALTRPAVPNFGSHYVDMYIGDTVPLGAVTLTGGVRFDVQRAKNFGSTVAANPVVPDLLPSVTYAGDTKSLQWQGFSPRLGATWAVDEAKKTVLRASYNRYMDQLGSSDAGASNPFYLVQELYYYWDDKNNDKTIQRNEIDFGSGLYSFSNIDPDHPSAGYAPGRLDYSVKPTTTDELVFGIEREIAPSFALGVSYSYRHRFNFLWDQYEKTRGASDFITKADYHLVNTLTGKLPDGTSYAVPYYGLNNNVAAPVFFVTTNRPDYYQTYQGLEFTATKRMTDKWMVRGNVTLQSWKQHVGPNGYIDPTALVSGDSCSSCNGEIVASSGGLGGYINARWSYSANGVYNLPFKFSLGAAVVGREGYVVPYYRRANARDGVGNKNVMVSSSFGSERLPNLFDLDLRLAKEIAATHGVALNLSIDLFNATNQRTVLWRDNRIYDATGVGGLNNQIQQLQSPRIWRLGARLSF